MPTNAEIAAAVALVVSLADDDAVNELEQALITSGLLYRCEGCGNNYPVDGSDDYCPLRYDDCGACQDGELHPHYRAVLDD